LENITTANIIAEIEHLRNLTKSWKTAQDKNSLSQLNFDNHIEDEKLWQRWTENRCKDLLIMIQEQQKTVDRIIATYVNQAIH
jgi:hypothetical protein